MPVRARLIVVALCLVVAGAGVHPQAAAQGGAQDEAFTTLLEPGFNLVGWVEAEATPDELFADLPEAVSLFGWDALGGEFLAARRSGPAFTNTLTQLLPGQGFWLEIASEGPVEWVRTRAAPSAALRLWPGNNLVGWLRDDAMEVEAAVASVGVALESVLSFDPATGTFDTFAPSLPAALNSLNVAGAWQRRMGADLSQRDLGSEWGGRFGRRLGWRLSGNVALCFACGGPAAGVGGGAERRVDVDHPGGAG